MLGYDIKSLLMGFGLGIIISSFATLSFVSIFYEGRSSNEVDAVLKVAAESASDVSTPKISSSPTVTINPTITPSPVLNTKKPTSKPTSTPKKKTKQESKKSKSNDKKEVQFTTQPTSASEVKVDTIVKEVDKEATVNQDKPVEKEEPFFKISNNE